MKLMLLVSGLVALASCGPAPTMKEMYSGPWQDPTSDVMRTLAENSVRGCGEFYQKANTEYAGEYVVVCNRMPDGSGRAAWVTYLVWPRTGKVEGPDMTAAYGLGKLPRDDPR